MNIKENNSSIYAKSDRTENSNEFPDLNERNNGNFDETQITFINYTNRYCICIIDIINSTKNIRQIVGSEKIRGFYSVFLNRVKSLPNIKKSKLIITIRYERG